MAAVALSSLQSSTSSLATPNPNSNRPKPLRTSRTDPSIPTIARRYSLFSDLPTTKAPNVSADINLHTHSVSKSRQRPQSTREPSLLAKRHRPDPQTNDNCSSPKMSDRSAQTAPIPSHHPPRPRDMYRTNRQSFNNLQHAASKPVNQGDVTRCKRTLSTNRHVRAASLGSAAARARSGANFSLSDFSLGKVLGAGGTATVIRVELVTKLNPGLSVKERLDSNRTNNIKQVNNISNLDNHKDSANRRHERRQSERISNTTDVGVNDPDDRLLSSISDEKVPEFALKVVQKKALSKRAKHYLTREIMIHRAVQSHINVVSLYDVFEDGAALYLVQELLRGGDLYSALKRERGGIPEITALEIVDQTLEALAFMHKRGFAHRDVKPENIMFSERPALGEGKVGTVKLIDFGLACARDPKAPVRERMSAEKCGTIRYAAPEVVTDVSYIPELADVWSVGVVLYSAIAHRNPYCGKNEKDVLEQIENGGPPFDGKEWAKVSKETKQLINDLLARKPTDRPSTQQALSVVRKIKLTLCERVEGGNNENDSKKKEGSENEDEGTRLSDERAPNIFDGILALFNGNSKEASS